MNTILAKRIYGSLFSFFFVLTIAYAEDYFLDLNKSISRLLKGVKLRKCHCRGNEVYVNGTCLPTDNTTVELLILDDYYHHFIVNTTNFDVIENSGIKCGFQKYPTKIDPRDLHLLTNGQLFHSISNVSFSIFDFCVDHVLNEHNEVLWEVQMCLESINIPVCCFLKQDQHKYCKNPTFPIGFGYSRLKNAHIKTYPGPDIECDSNKTYTRTEISDPTNLTSPVYISYHNQATQLVVYPNSNHHVLPTSLKSDEFCVIPHLHDNNKVTYTVGFCNADPALEHQMFCQDFTCVRKCCPIHHLYSHLDRSCVSADGYSEWTPTFYSKNGSVQMEEPDNLKLSFGFPICKRSFYSFNPEDPDDAHILLENGDIYIFSWQDSVSAPRYCIDNFVQSDEKVVQTTLTCFSDVAKPETQCSKVKNRLFPILFVISCVFLLITIIVYASIQDLHAKLHGKSLLSHVIALFVGSFFLAIIRYTASSLSMFLCRTFGKSLLQYFYNNLDPTVNAN